MFVKRARLADFEIVRLVRLKNRAAAEALYDGYARALFLAIYRIVPQKQVAEDIVEQTFVEIWNSFDLYLVQEEKLITWTMKIARRSARITLRLKRFHQI